MSRVLITGANGLVGRSLCRALLGSGHDVTGLVRRKGPGDAGIREWVHGTSDFDGLDVAWPDEWIFDCVVHLAARVHMLHDDAPDPLAAFRATNVEGMLRVARAAQRRGVRRFVFVSSIKAVAESDGGRPLNEETPATPGDAYGRSKLEAEEALWRLQEETGLEVVVARPPLVYGPGVGANFLALLRAVSRGIPLPFGAVSAQRSLIYTENLVDALARCVDDPRAANNCFHVADDEALSVSDLLREVARHLRRPARLLPISTRLLRAAGELTGRSAQIDRLTSSLQIDTSRIRAVLGWHPPFSVADGLEATARWYRDCISIRRR